MKCGIELCGELHESVSLFNDRNKSSVLTVYSLAKTEDRVSDRLNVASLLKGMVSEVLSINLTFYLNTGAEFLYVFKVEECSGTVGVEGVTLVGVVSCSHVGEDLDTVKTVKCFVETNSVCRKSYRNAVLVKCVLKSHLKERR